MSPVPLRPFAGYGRTCEVKHGVSWHVRDVLHPLALGGHSATWLVLTLGCSTSGAHVFQHITEKQRFRQQSCALIIASALSDRVYFISEGSARSIPTLSGLMLVTRYGKALALLHLPAERPGQLATPLPGDNGGRAIYPQRRLRKRKPQGSTHRWKFQDDCGAAS